MFSLYPHNTNTQDKVEDITYISSLDSQMAQKYRMNSGERKREREREKNPQNKSFPSIWQTYSSMIHWGLLFFFFFVKTFIWKLGTMAGELHRFLCNGVARFQGRVSLQGFFWGLRVTLPPSLTTNHSCLLLPPGGPHAAAHAQLRPSEHARFSRRGWLTMIIGCIRWSYPFERENKSSFCEDGIVV